MRQRLSTLMGAALLLAALALPLAAQQPAHHATAAGLGAWSCPDAPASVAYKDDGFSGTIGGVGSGLPEPALAVVSADFRARQWVVWLYPPGETHRYAWSAAAIASTQPGGLPTGRIDPTGNPVVFYHDGRLKALYGEWGGDGNPDVALYRVDFGCTYTP